LASPKLPLHGTLALPPVAVPKARWVPAVLKPLIGSLNATAGGASPQSTAPGVPTVTPVVVVYPRSS
jgi:hypothetical protein